jgi:hypothetical protein
MAWVLALLARGMRKVSRGAARAGAGIGLRTRRPSLSE